MKDVFESLICYLDHWLSCILDCLHVCVFPLSKNCFEKLARHLINTSSIASYLSSFLSFFFFFNCNLISTSIPSRLIEKVSDPSIAFRHLVDRSSLISCFWCFYSSIASRHMICQRCFSRHHLDTSSIEIYWGFYLISSCNPLVIFSISLSIDCCFLSQTLSSLPQICSPRFLQASPSFSSRGKLLFSCISCIHVFET